MPLQRSAIGVKTQPSEKGRLQAIVCLPEPGSAPVLATTVLSLALVA